MQNIEIEKKLEQITNFRKENPETEGMITDCLNAMTEYTCVIFDENFLEENTGGDREDVERWQDDYKDIIRKQYDKYIELASKSNEIFDYCEKNKLQSPINGKKIDIPECKEGKDENDMYPDTRNEEFGKRTIDFVSKVMTNEQIKKGKGLLGLTDPNEPDR